MRVRRREVGGPFRPTATRDPSTRTRCRARAASRAADYAGGRLAGGQRTQPVMACSRSTAATVANLGWRRGDG
ncbi:phenolpthiocerol synthesis type-I polyketide synthase ppsc domain protein [Mycobacterium ulcerans str. Harvey]|uniref:Phenolpthiocerol synthesis type-I polyketide synthase ppsc domain protein n=1 Tax=Mycobacterium ulcerans str. Harvey TaxID=1299332 RepID=A0ABN0R060_MYCUL|nr:phenolpthiocerol synthesis type-I polyketide synthase ppsc domain protein [Mycobacterium ulcerans str. Harvey]